ncbi:MAG: ATP-binding protein [Sandaracinaceae bacterium]|nr:ATP-binding protein [Sandaracinaceae bacterium]
MARANPNGRLGARLEAARERGFVGRAAAVELFRQALEPDEPPFAAYFVHGPGGVGKTTLVQRLLREARAAGAATLRIDGHATQPSHTAALRGLGVESLDALPDALGAAPRAVVAIDTYELLAPLDEWVREELAPALPAHAILLIAGRDPPSAAWRADPGWASLLVTVALENLTREESAALLAARGVPPAAHAPIHDATYGHPLALALVADVFREGDTSVPALEADVVGALLDAMLRAVPSPAHREALEVAALARTLDQSLLRELAGDDADGALYAWLRSLSFVTVTPDGLSMHDVVRDALLADARARDAGAARERLVAVGRRAIARLLDAPRPEDRERGAMDLLHVYRADPAWRPFYSWAGQIGGSSRPMRPEELADATAILREHEGARAAAMAEALHARRPEAFVTLESAAGEALGYLVYARLDAEALAEEAARDPIFAAAERLVARLGPLRPGEHAGVLRFWPWKTGYQELGSPAHAPHSTHLMIEWCSARGLGPTICVVQHAERWAPFFDKIGLSALETERLDGRRFTLFAQDFRRRPPSSWMSGDPATSRVEPAEVLSRSGFEEAVREALKSHGHPEALARSPLLTSRAMLDWAEGEAPTAAMLRELLEVAVSSLADERDDRARRAVELTYLRPAPTQEIAAERLGLSFSTYRRQLARGVEGVVDYLWRRELSER